MSATIALRMIGADFLKIRRRIGNVSVALFFACGPLIIFFIVRAAQHSSNPTNYGPAGGVEGFTDGIRVLALLFGALAAILIGTDAGAGDASAGVFRDLVVTGRSRLALFASRVPAALLLSWLVALVGFIVLLIGTFAFSSGSPNPSGSLIVDGLLFMLLTTGVVSVITVGLASLTTNRAVTIAIFIGWEFIASPLIASISSLGRSRRLDLSQAFAHFSPVHLGDRSMDVSMGTAEAIIVLAVWVVVFVGLGAWRTRAMDS